MQITILSPNPILGLDGDDKERPDNACWFCGEIGLGEWFFICEHCHVRWVGRNIKWSLNNERDWLKSVDASVETTYDVEVIDFTKSDARHHP